MKKLIGLSIIVAFVGVGSLHADSAAGEKLFKKKGCSACHNPTKDQLKSGLGPSLVMVSEAYKAADGKDGLTTFLLGKGKPIVAPKKFAIMRGQLSGTKKMSDEERANLADYILSN